MIVVGGNVAGKAAGDGAAGSLVAGNAAVEATPGLASGRDSERGLGPSSSGCHQRSISSQASKGTVLLTTLGPSRPLVRRPLGPSRRFVGPESAGIVRTKQVQLQAKIAVNEGLRVPSPPDQQQSEQGCDRP